MRELELRVAVLIIGIVIVLLSVLLLLIVRIYRVNSTPAQESPSIGADFPPFDNIDQFKAIFYERHLEFIEKCHVAKLTARETELAALKEIGVSNPRIAELMGISQGTVYTLTKRVKKKRAKT